MVDVVLLSCFSVTPCSIDFSETQRGNAFILTFPSLIIVIRLSCVVVVVVCIYSCRFRLAFSLVIVLTLVGCCYVVMVLLFMSCCVQEDERKK